MVALDAGGAFGCVDRVVELGLGAHQNDARAALAGFGFDEDWEAAECGLGVDQFAGALGPVGLVRTDGVLRQDAVVVEPSQDGLLALAGDAAAGRDAGVDTRPDRERAVAEGERGEARHDEGIEEPGGPPLVVGDAAHGRGDAAAAVAGEGEFDCVEQDGDGGEIEREGEPAEVGGWGAGAGGELGDEQGERGPDREAERPAGVLCEPGLARVEGPADEQAEEGDAEVDGGGGDEQAGEGGCCFSSQAGEASADGGGGDPMEAAGGAHERVEERAVGPGREVERAGFGGSTGRVVARQERLEMAGGFFGLEEGHEVAVRRHDEARGGDELVVALGGPVGDERVVSAVEDEDGGIERFHDGADGALVGVEEVAHRA